MKVKDLMVKNVISVQPEDSLTIALNKMRDGRLNQLPVVEGGRYVGMLTLKSIVTRNINPAQIKCGSMCSSTPTVRSGDDIEIVISTMLNAGVRALPVVDDNLVGVISETDLIRAATAVGIGGLPISKIATDSEFVMKTDSVAKVKKIMMNNNVSRVPVVDAGKVIGVVGTLDMIRLTEGKRELPGRSSEHVEKEKLNIESTPVINFMHNPSVVSKNATVKDVLASLTRYEEAFVLENGVKIITPKDVLELMASGPKSQVHVDVIGMGDEGPLLTAKVDKSVSDFVTRMNKSIADIQYLFLHVEKYDKGGKKPLYSIRARFGTPIGMFVARAEERDAITAVQEVLHSLEREIEHKTGKAKSARKKSRVLKKRR